MGSSSTGGPARLPGCPVCLDLGSPTGELRGTAPAACSWAPGTLRPAVVLNEDFSERANPRSSAYKCNVIVVGFMRSTNKRELVRPAACIMETPGPAQSAGRQESWGVCGGCRAGVGASFTGLWLRPFASYRVGETSGATKGLQGQGQRRELGPILKWFWAAAGAKALAPHLLAVLARRSPPAHSLLWKRSQQVLFPAAADEGLLPLWGFRPAARSQQPPAALCEPAAPRVRGC